jgi:hypothetical protein
MNKPFLIVASLAALAGCGGGFAVRSPEMFAADTQKVLAPKNGDILTCYDGVLKSTPGVGGKVTVHFEIPKAEDPGAGTITNVKVDPAGTTAPPQVADCVTRNITGAGSLSPADQHVGEGTAAWEFSAPPAHPKS